MAKYFWLALSEEYLYYSLLLRLHYPSLCVLLGTNVPQANKNVNKKLPKWNFLKYLLRNAISDIFHTEFDILKIVIWNRPEFECM